MPSNSDDTTEDIELDPIDWTGIYYDANNGTFIELEFRNDGTVAIIPEGHDEPDMIYECHTAFTEQNNNLYRVPKHAIENPVSVAEDIYAKGFKEYLNQYPENDIAILYAGEHTQIIETNE